MEPRLLDRRLVNNQLPLATHLWKPTQLRLLYQARSQAPTLVSNLRMIPEAEKIAPDVFV
jgi:hypothetical protein